MARHSGDRIRCVALVLGGLLLSGVALACQAGGEGKGDSTESQAKPLQAPTGSGAESPLTRVTIFADEAFYRERPEREQVLEGRLRRSEVRTGPNTRDMPFALLVNDRRYVVYSGGVEDKVLAPFVGRDIEIVGKLIDQSAEGFGDEIWIARLSLKSTEAGDH